MRKAFVKEQQEEDSLEETSCDKSGGEGDRASSTRKMLSRERKQFEATTLSGKTKSFQHVAARLRAAIVQQRQDDMQEERTVESTIALEGAEHKGKENIDAAGARKAGGTATNTDPPIPPKKPRRAPLPSRRVREAIPPPSMRLRPSIDTDWDLPLEVEPKDLIKFAEIFKISLSELGILESETVRAVFGAFFNQIKHLRDVLHNGITNPSRKALSDCHNNPYARAVLESILPMIPILHALFVVPEVRTLDFVVQPLKQLIVDVVDSNPCGHDKSSSQCQDVYNVLENVFSGFFV